MYTVGFGSAAAASSFFFPAPAPLPALALACAFATQYGSSQIPAGVRSKLPSVLHARRRKNGVDVASPYSLIESYRTCSLKFIGECSAGSARAPVEVDVDAVADDLSREGRCAAPAEDDVDVPTGLSLGESAGMTAGRGAGEGDLSGLLDGPAPGDGPSLGLCDGCEPDVDERLECDEPVRCGTG